MSQPLVCYCLIGLPASGKSTLARILQEIIPNAAIVSSDTARHKLYGDETEQGDWAKEVEPEVLEQIKNAIASNKPVIYDATNARRDWRMGMLMKIEEKLKEIDAPQVYWVAWHLQTPVDVCKEWNKKRDRQVPENVIEQYSKFLEQFEPNEAEGFLKVYDMRVVEKESLAKISSASYQAEVVHKKTKKLWCIECIKNEGLTFDAIERCVKAKNNRNNKYKFHRYSSLIDFERLMHLISLIIEFPGIGSLYRNSPEIVFQVIGDIPDFRTDLDEISAFMSSLKGELYANREAIILDLDWLKLNGFIGNCENLSSELVHTNAVFTDDVPTFYTHTYSDYAIFSKLIKLIRYIIHGDVMPMPVKEKRLAENLYNLLDHDKFIKLINSSFRDDRDFARDIQDDSRLYSLFDNNIDDKQQNRLKKNLRNRKSILIKALIIKMIDSGALSITKNDRPKKQTDTDKGCYIDNIIRYDSQIYKTYLPDLKKYKIKLDIDMTEGYYFGTGLFSKKEINDIYNLIKSQSEEQHFNDPLDFERYQRYRERIEKSHFFQDPYSYPIKAIGSKSIVDFENGSINNNRFNEFEKSIKDSMCIEVSFNGIKDPWTQELRENIVIFPIQIIFHSNAWYLGYEVVEGSEKGLLYFERIDRLKKVKDISQGHTNKQIAAFNKLRELYRYSAGIYLGKSVRDQKDFLSQPFTKKPFEKIEIHVSDKCFRFLSETTTRFDKRQVEMTHPDWLYTRRSVSDDIVFESRLKNNSATHPNIIKIDLPKWSIDDIYLIKWLVPWGKEVKVVKPQKLMDLVKERGEGIVNLY